MYYEVLRKLAHRITIGVCINHCILWDC